MIVGFSENESNCGRCKLTFSSFEAGGEKKREPAPWEAICFGVGKKYVEGWYVKISQSAYSAFFCDDFMFGLFFGHVQQIRFLLNCGNEINI